MTTSQTVAAFVVFAIFMTALAVEIHHRRKEKATARVLPMHEILNWLVRRTARIEDKLNRLHDKTDRLMTKKDGAAILKSIEDLRDMLSKPRLNVELGKPTDQGE